jgi:hypothetical protein
MTRIHVKPGQSLPAAIAEATQVHDVNERAHRSTMTLELGLDYVVLNGHRIVRPSGVPRSHWEKFWGQSEQSILGMHWRLGKH